MRGGGRVCFECSCGSSPWDAGWGLHLGLVVLLSSCPFPSKGEGLDRNEVAASGWRIEPSARRSESGCSGWEVYRYAIVVIVISIAFPSCYDVPVSSLACCSGQAANLGR